jgi:hypothetical protein
MGIDDEGIASTLRSGQSTTSGDARFELQGLFVMQLTHHEMVR